MTLELLPVTIKYTSVKFDLITNTQVYTSPLSGAVQTVEIPGAKWRAFYQCVPFSQSDDTHGIVKGFLSGLRGSSGRFLGYDPSLTRPRGLVSGVPEFKVTGLYPSSTLYPSMNLKPKDGGNFEAISGIDSVTLKNALISGNAAKLQGLQSWDYATAGINTAFEQAKPYLKAGDYVGIGRELKILSRDSIDDYENGVCDIEFEPAIRESYAAGTTVNLNRPYCVMRLVDDNQAGWSVSPGGYHQISFEAIEVFT